jgi:F-type H+-transporting ATPase subunit delta
MSSHAKNARQLARQLYKLSVVDGAVSPERVAGALAYVEKHRPPNPVMVLKDYHRLIALELARGNAVVEHAGQISQDLLQGIAAALGRKYRRPVAATARPNPALLAGLRVRLGDDVYDTSIAGRLSALAATV